AKHAEAKRDLAAAQEAKTQAEEGVQAANAQLEAARTAAAEKAAAAENAQKAAAHQQAELERLTAAAQKYDERVAQLQ
ncbi:hypothetical protein R6H00_11035, partial [Actinotignum timonense]|nr:hypothetical protein [Actinotignum timonense]